jgi:ferredoxin-type protein NapG
MNEELNRRNYLKLNWKASLGFLGHVIARKIEQERDCFRPPGASSELDFLTYCTRCGKCSAECPEGIIRLRSLDSGAGKMSTPYLDPNQSACTFCLRCIEICPTKALDLVSFNEKSSIGLAKIRLDGCIAYQNVMCDYCIRACPIQGALTQENGLPHVNKEKCNGCGICVSNCISESKGIWVHLCS